MDGLEYVLEYMSTAERRQEEKEQRRQDIIDAAEVVFAQKGVEKATMADVAREARLSRGLIYFYFKDKDALYLAIMVRATQALHEAFVKASAGRENGLEKIKSIGRAYVRFHYEMPNYFDAMADFESRTITPEDMSEGERDCLFEGRKVLELMAAVIVEGMEDGSIRSDLGNPMSAAVSLWGFTHGMLQVFAKKESMMSSQFNLHMDDLLNHGFEMMNRSLINQKE